MRPFKQVQTSYRGAKVNQVSAIKIIPVKWMFALVSTTPHVGLCAQASTNRIKYVKFSVSGAQGCRKWSKESMHVGPSELN